MISDIMKNAADQAAWEEILYLCGDQLDKVGRKLGPGSMFNAEGIADEFEIAGDIFGQFIDEHKVEFHYPHV